LVFKSNSQDFDDGSQKAGKGAYSQPFHVILFGAVRFIKAIFAPVMPGCKAPFEAAKRPLTCWRHEARPL